MDPIIIKDILSNEDVKRIQSSIDFEFANRPEVQEIFPSNNESLDYSVVHYSGSGRTEIKFIPIPEDIVAKLTEAVKNSLDDKFENVVFNFAIYADYSKASGGNPKLGPHFDILTGGSAIILDYQLKSNTLWPLKVESELFELADNDALLFDPVEKIHSRTIKSFSDSDFVKMIFFRFSSMNDLVEKTEQDELRLKKEIDRYETELRNIDINAITNSKKTGKGI